MKKLVAVVLLFIVLIAVLNGLKLFVMGIPATEDSLAVQVEEGDGQVAIYIQITDSARAISDIQYHYEDTVLRLTVYTVLISPLYDDGEYCLYYEILDETEIWLGNRLIWSK